MGYILLEQGLLLYLLEVLVLQELPFGVLLSQGLHFLLVVLRTVRFQVQSVLGVVNSIDVFLFDNDSIFYVFLKFFL